MKINKKKFILICMKGLDMNCYWNNRVRFHLLKIHLLLPYLYFYLFVCQRMNMPSSPRYQTTKTLGITSIYWLIWWKQTSYSSTHTDLRVYSKYYVLGILSSPPPSRQTHSSCDRLSQNNRRDRCNVVSFTKNNE